MAIPFDSMQMTENRFTDIFNVTVHDLERLIGTALSGGGDYSDLYFEHSSYGELMLRDGAVTSGGFHVDYGVGIRVLKGEKTGYAYSESTIMDDMLSAARTAALIAGNSTVMNKEHEIRVSKPASPDFYGMKESWNGIPAVRMLPFLKDLESRIYSKDRRVVKVLARLSYSESEIMMFNSYGELTFDSRPMGNVSVSVIMNENGKTENKSVSRSFRAGAELITEGLAEELASESVSGMDERFRAGRPKGGVMPVVMGAGASGILLHEAMGHAFEADFNRKGQSVFSDKMGQKICSESVNIVDDGTLYGNRGSCNFDDEGIPGQKTYMVRDGMLVSYLHDRISAKWFGTAPTGNGRRESFRFNPIPRMRSTYMENGPYSPEEIISSVNEGIYVDEFSNGQVKIGEGDFTFYVKSGFLIKNGKLGDPIKDINIIGNGPKALADIIAVGNDLKIDNGIWTCGKGQSVPVTCGIPTVLVRSLTVGGSAEE